MPTVVHSFEPSMPDRLSFGGRDIIREADFFHMEAAPMQATMPAAAPKQKIVAFLLAFFLGALGVHNFYLGKTKMGVVQLILTITVIGAIVSGPWAFVQSIMIILGKIDDADGNPLV